jgi:hypothetical protein
MPRGLSWSGFVQRVETTGLFHDVSDRGTGGVPTNHVPAGWQCQPAGSGTNSSMGKGFNWGLRTGEGGLNEDCGFGIEDLLWIWD